MYLSKSEQENLRLLCGDEASYKRVLAFLSQKESQEAKFLEQLPLPITVVDAKQEDHPIVYANPAFEALTGYSKDAISGKNPRFLQQADRQQVGLARVREAIRDGTATTATIRNYRNDGNIFWNQMRMFPIHDDEGNLTHFLSCHEDVTAEVETHDQTQLIDYIYGYFIENTGDMIALYTPDNKLMYANPAVSKVLGFSMVELRELSPKDYFHPDDFERVSQKLQEGIASASPISHIEYRIIKKDGDYIPVEAHITAIYDNRGELSHLLVISRDISERIRRSEQQFRTLVENNPDRIQRTNYEGRFLYVNPALAQAWGMNADDIIGKTNAELGISGSLLEELDQARHSVFQSGEVMDIEFVYNPGDGAHIYQARLVPEFDTEGNVETMLSIVRDVTELKTAEYALQKSEALLRKAQEVAGIGSWEYYFNTDKAVWSDEFFRICGLEPQSVEPTGKLGFSLIHPDDRERAGIAVQQAQEEAKPYNIEKRIVRPDGEVRYVDSRGEVVFDEESGSPKLIGTFFDITERKLAELALQESETRANALLDAIPDMVFHFDRDGYYLDFHGPREPIIADAPIIGQRVHDRVGEEMGEIVLEKIQRALSSGELQTYEQTLNISDGKFRSFETRIVPVGENNAIAVVRDISDGKKAQIALKASEAQANALLAAIPDLVFSLNRDGQYLDIHGNRDKLLVDENEIIGTYIADYFGIDLSQKFRDAIASTLNDGKIQTLNYVIDLPDGTHKEHEARLIASRENEVIAIVRDITEQKRIQEHKMRIAIESERTMILSQFIQMASHEFRTPLSVISTNLHMLIGLDDEEKRQQKIERINKQILQLNKLIDMQLLMTKLDSGVVMSRQHLSVVNIMDRILVQLEHKLQEKLIKIQQDIRPDTLTIRADANYLQKALFQLVDNAIRYSHAGDEIFIRAYPAEDGLCIEIEDKGIGIADDEISHLFERFWRKDKAQTVAGLGLGLPLAQKIVELHDGEIEVSSILSQGTTFRIKLPV